MSRTCRFVHWRFKHPFLMELTHAGLGDPESFWNTSKRNHNVNGYDGALRDARHVNTLKREQRTKRRRRRQAEKESLKNEELVE